MFQAKEPVVEHMLRLAFVKRIKVQLNQFDEVSFTAFEGVEGHGKEWLRSYLMFAYTESTDGIASSEDATTAAENLIAQAAWTRSSGSSDTGGKTDPR